MSGIDKIIQQIEDDADLVCRDILAHAEQKANEIINEANEQAAQLRSDGEQAVANSVAEIAKRGESSAELECRKILLYTKQNIITQMLQKAIDAVKGLPDAEYFDLILDMIKKYSLAKDGVIRFGKKDDERMPNDWMKKVNAASNGHLTLSEPDADIDAGFILIYGGVEENCSFDAIFAGADETLKDRAGKLLF